MVLGVVLPIIVQNGITNFVSLLDNIMVGRVGTEQMSGVAIVNQLMFVFNISIFGAISGAGIFGAQFFGCGKTEGVRHTFRFKLIICVIITVLACLLFLFAGDFLIRLYLHGEENAAQLEATLQYGKKYLLVMIIGLPAFSLAQAYTSTLRECGETVVPMVAGIVAVMVNCLFNVLLIFGFLGFPKLGVVGAAVATVLCYCLEDVSAEDYTTVLNFVFTLTGVDVPSNLVGFAGSSIKRIEGIDLIVSTVLRPLVVQYTTDDAPADNNVTLAGYRELSGFEKFIQLFVDFFAKVKDFFLMIFSFNPFA